MAMFPAVTTLKVGDNVIISCIKSCGRCAYCKESIYAHCLGDEGVSGIGRIFGHLSDGTQAEFVRVPYVENSVYLVPKGVTNQQGVMLSEILPTGFEIGVQHDKVKPGDVVTVIGAGPVGLAAITTASSYGPSKIIAIDLDANRIEQAKKFDASDGINSGDSDWLKQVMALTDGMGFDVAIEAVGMPTTFETATQIVRPGRHVANIGVHGKPVELRLQDLWIHNIAITMGLVNTNTLPRLLKLVAEKKLNIDNVASHHRPFKCRIFNIRRSRSRV